MRRNQQRFEKSYSEIHTQYAPWEAKHTLADLMNMNEIEDLIDYRKLINKVISLKRRQIKLDTRLPIWTMEPDEAKEAEIADEAKEVKEAEEIREATAEYYKKCMARSAKEKKEDRRRRRRERKIEELNKKCEEVKKEQERLKKEYEEKEYYTNPQWDEWNEETDKDYISWRVDIDELWCNINPVPEDENEFKAWRRKYREWKSKMNDRRDKWHNSNMIKNPKTFTGAALVFNHYGENDCSNKIATRQAYKRLVIKYHPDKKNGDAAKFVQIQNAYEIMKSCFA